MMTSKKTLFESKAMSVSLLASKVGIGDIVLSRRFNEWGSSASWTVKMQREFIESILIQMPTPSIFIDGTDEYNFVIDGIERLRAIDYFVNYERFALKELEVFDELNGSKFGNLERKFQRRILETCIPTNTIIRVAHPQNIKDVYRRIRGISM